MSTLVSEHVQMITGFPKVAIITGARATLVVDTGMGPKNGETITKVARKLTQGPKLYLTTTHFHPEQAAGDGGFPPETILIRSATRQTEMDQKRPGHDRAILKNESAERRSARAGKTAQTRHHFRRPRIKVIRAIRH